MAAAAGLLHHNFTLLLAPHTAARCASVLATQGSVRTYHRAFQAAAAAFSSRLFSTSSSREAAAEPKVDLHINVEPLSEPYEGVSVLTLNRPDAKNAIGKQLLRELGECINNLRQERTTRCVIVRSSVPGGWVGLGCWQRAATVALVSAPTPLLLSLPAPPKPHTCLAPRPQTPHLHLALKPCTCFLPPNPAPAPAPAPCPQTLHLHWRTQGFSARVLTSRSVR